MTTPAEHANTQTDLRITFTHPRSNKKFAVELSPDHTGQEVVDGLIEEGFLTKPDRDGVYTLQHAATRREIPLDHTLLDAGVANNDVVAVVQDNEGHTAVGTVAGA